jgi:hypothetical protein
LIKLGQVVAKAGFLVEFGAESRTVYPDENEVSVHANACFTSELSAAAATDSFRATVYAKLIP